MKIMDVVIGAIDRGCERRWQDGKAGIKREPC